MLIGPTAQAVRITVANRPGVNITQPYV